MDSGNDADERHQKQHRGYDAVDNPHRTDVEVAPDLVDEECHKQPPAYSSGGNAELARDVVVGLLIESKETEPGNPADDGE